MALLPLAAGATTFIVPAAGTGGGANGSRWQSELTHWAITLGDQPRMPAAVVPALLEAFRRSGKAIVAPVYQGVQGTPVVFSSEVFAELRVLTGDAGARAVVRAQPERVETVAFDLAMPPDVDAPAGLRARPRKPGRGSIAIAGIGGHRAESYRFSEASARRGDADRMGEHRRGCGGVATLLPRPLPERRASTERNPRGRQ